MADNYYDGNATDAFNDDFFEHVGRKGMKWYQHIYGAAPKSLNEAKTYSKSSSDISKNLGTINDSVSGIRQYKRKNRIDVSHLSDQELQRRINRMNLEQKYIELSTKDRTRGEIYTKRALEIGGASLGIVTTGLTTAVAIQTLRANKKAKPTP